MIRALFIIAILFPSVCSAYSIEPDNILNSLSFEFINEIKAVAAPVKQAATRLFFLLLPIAIVMLGLKLLFKSGSLQTFFYEMVKLTLITGIYLFLLNNGDKIGMSIIDSLCSIVSNDAQGPSELVDLVFNITGKIANHLNNMVLSTGVGIMFRVITIAFMIILSLVVIRYTTTFICAYVLCIIGVIVLGFGAYCKTRAFATNYLKTVIAIALQLMTYNVIFKAANAILSKMLILIDKGTLDTLELNDFLCILFTALFIYYICHALPPLVGSLVKCTSSFSKAFNISPVTKSATEVTAVSADKISKTIV